ncbi:hypothetical protein, partial [Klebsiella pneumoniae]|uniref:hypothetical protein n=1 Tax=Klebsiella pneumoniae TaxID=573 RepID=UPI001C6FC339
KIAVHYAINCMTDVIHNQQKKACLKSRRTSLDHIRNELQYHLADRATDLPGKRIPRIARISYSSTFPEGKPARQAGGLSAMQPDVAPGFPGEPLDSLTDSWSFNSAVAVSTPP